VIAKSCFSNLLIFIETYETMFHLWHTLGIQSNILVGARYKNSASGGGLTKSVVFKALESVIADHPALGMVGISRESEKKKGNHRLWEARLKSVDLRDCVIFEEGVDLETELPRLIEEAHNNYAWFNTGDTTAPVSTWVSVSFSVHILVPAGVVSCRYSFASPSFLPGSEKLTERP